MNIMESFHPIRILLLCTAVLLLTSYTFTHAYDDADPYTTGERPDDDDSPRGCMGCCAHISETRTFSSNAPTSYNPNPEPVKMYGTCSQYVQMYMTCLQKTCLTVNYASLCPSKERSLLAQEESSVGGRGRAPIPELARSPDEAIWKQPVERHITKGSWLPHYLFNGPLGITFPPVDSHPTPGSPVPPCGHTDVHARKCWKDYMDCVHGVVLLDDGKRDEGYASPTYYSCFQCMTTFDSCVDQTSPCTSDETKHHVEHADVGLDARTLENVRTNTMEQPAAGSEPITREAVERLIAEENAARSAQTAAATHIHDEL